MNPDDADYRTELASVRRRLEAMAERARVNAACKADDCVSLARDLNLDGADAGVPLSKAERLAQASTALVRYLSALEAYEAALALLEDT
jgi:hypothetical protein